jgi:photosystem II stability/assembly factor-like uncharacterized protein
MAGNYTICVGTIGSGLWLSPDCGDTWNRVRDGLTGESRVYGLTVHPAEPCTVFAGAEDGIYKSRDGGQSFTRLDSPMSCEVWKIAIDPTDPDIIFAGTRPAALYRSTDGGRNWRKLPADIVEECPNVGTPRVTALTVDPSDHRNVWAGIEVDGVRRSTDGGDSWSRVTNGVYDLDIHDIAVTVNGGTLNGATKVLTSTPGEVFASGDLGENWRGLGVRDQFDLRYCRGLAQKADDPETLLVATGDAAVGSTGAIQRSRDGGRSWEKRPLPVEPNSPIWAFATHAADPDLIVACSHYGEVYVTRDAGDSWRKLRREFTEIRALCWVPN